MLQLVPEGLLPDGRYGSPTACILAEAADGDP